MKRNHLLVTLALLTGSLAVKAQDMKLLQGDIAPLKSESSFAILFSYDHMTVGKYSNEQDYIDKHKADLNAKEPGRGDQWAKTWVDDRGNSFEPKFKELFTKYSSTTVSKDAKYTLIFKTTFTEVGFAGYGFVRKNASINGEAWFVETADTSHVIARISVQNAPGRGAMGYDYDTGLRIQEAYAMAGRALGKYIRK